MEQPRYAQMDTVTHGLHCLELKRHGRSLFHASGHGYTWFPVSGAEMKWNKFAPMPMDTVTHVSECFLMKQSGTNCCTRMDLVTRGDYVEQAGYMPNDTFTCGSHWLK